MAGFVEPPKAGKRTFVQQAGMLVAVAGIWIVTCVFPVTFMLLMGYSCVNGTTTLGTRARSYYGRGGDATHRRAPEAPVVSRRRRLLRGGALAASLGIPLAALAVAAHSRPAGVHWYYVLIALAGLAVVIALSTVIGHR
jgi:hypothetical protein